MAGEYRSSTSPATSAAAAADSAARRPCPFQDSLQPELATVTGDTTSGYTAALTIGIAS
jgi:hypothetical protein